MTTVARDDSPLGFNTLTRNTVMAMHAATGQAMPTAAIRCAVSFPLRTKQVVLQSQCVAPHL